jgi:hypothetical protein
MQGRCQDGRRAIKNGNLMNYQIVIEKNSPATFSLPVRCVNNSYRSMGLRRLCSGRFRHSMKMIRTTHCLGPVSANFLKTLSGRFDSCGWVAARRLSMMRIMARRTKAATVRVMLEVTRQTAAAADGQLWPLNRDLAESLSLRAQIA